MAGSRETDGNKEQAADGARSEVRAAGGVISRGAGTDLELVIVHRPRYDDWTFPKGKAESGETDEQTAHREVLEETGFDCELGEELPSVTYRDHKNRSKIVRYWEMTIRSGVFEANDEVDILEWVSAAEAGERLTYDHDVDVLSAFLTLVSER
ncbi:MAG: NUDIX domain-containing protein [Actinobacteria bacterium]|nr:NUDIX domain-containing protein [Actinomycetota bacterium]MSX34058.1 NUDIX domain-containing protein [Actinomycetota bacterium]MSY24980.1 NUDIX domain-containing protein [Actinomycetota bacterium]MSY33859.1 NUDIX domain-containing protein [Actinomycetota bacterium]MTA42060.1 NUDIX domain-containing protein [Actinomycetota bacterium]